MLFKRSVERGGTNERGSQKIATLIARFLSTPYGLPIENVAQQVTPGVSVNCRVSDAAPEAMPSNN